MDDLFPRGSFERKFVDLLYRIDRILEYIVHLKKTNLQNESKTYLLREPPIVKLKRRIRRLKLKLFEEILKCSQNLQNRQNQEKKEE